MTAWALKGQERDKKHLKNELVPCLHFFFLMAPIVRYKYKPTFSSFYSAQINFINFFQGKALIEKLSSILYEVFDLTF